MEEIKKDIKEPNLEPENKDIVKENVSEEDRLEGYLKKVRIESYDDVDWP